ncbi:phage tail protein [Streptomyces sp. NPDC021225]|uniref:phage tail protein n=1 Tax=Streptomyces sp. NPDC021225 TaxID=3365121 RepID=UPI0037905D5D
MLPESIPTVKVTGRYLDPSGKPLSGQVVWRAPALLTFAEADVMLSGPVTAPLDTNGTFAVVLPATDAPDMDPTGWAYTVTEQLTGVSSNRSYNVLLPAAKPEVDLADLAPTDPTTPNYVPVQGESAYEVAVADGYTGTVTQWLASLVGPAGPKGDTGPQGPEGDDAYEVAVAGGYTGSRAQWLASLIGPKGDKGDQGTQGPPGVVQSVNGISAAAVTLTAANVGAIPSTAAGAANGVAQLDASGKVPAAQLPASSGGGGVQTINGVSPDGSGNVALTAANVGAVATADKGVANGVATLGADGSLTSAQRPAYTAAQVGAIATTARGAANGVAPLDANSDVPVANLPTAAIPGVFLPSDLGFKAWTFDPALTDATAQYCQIGYVYLMGIMLREAATLSRICFYTAGNGATQPNNQSFAGLYNASGSRVAQTTSLNNWFTTNKGATVECGLSANYSAATGLYWIALLINGPSTPTSGPGFARGAAAGSNPSGQARASSVSFIRHGRLSTTSLTALPASFTPTSAIVPDANAMWAAVY